MTKRKFNSTEYKGIMTLKAGSVIHAEGIPFRLDRDVPVSGSPGNVMLLAGDHCKVTLGEKARRRR